MQYLTIKSVAQLKIMCTIIIRINIQASQGLVFKKQAHFHNITFLKYYICFMQVVIEGVCGPQGFRWSWPLQYYWKSIKSLKMVMLI